MTYNSKYKYNDTDTILITSSTRYMNRNYKLDKDTTQRLLDLAVEDNLVKLHKKVSKLFVG